MMTICSDIGVWIVPRLDQCRALTERAGEEAALDVLSSPSVREFFQRQVDELHRSGTGSATRLRPARVLSHRSR